MKVTVLILSMILLFVGFEAFNVGGLISPLFIYGGYAFVLIHLFIIIGLYKNIKAVTKCFIGENLFFISLVCYYIISIPKLNFGPFSYIQTKPIINNYLRNLTYGIMPLALFITNIIITILWSRKDLSR